MTKIYGIPGMTSAILTIPIGSGRSSLTLEFSRGCTDRKAYRPATYKSDSPVEQAIIESSGYFGKTIFVEKIIGEPEETEAVDDMEAPEATEYPEVEDFAGAVAVLKKQGVKASLLRSEEQVRRIATSKNINFPNWE